MFARFAVAAILAGCVQPAAAQSLEQMAGQMIVIGFQGDSVGDKGVKYVLDELAAGGIGGVMYLKTNVASRDAVIEMNRAFNAAAEKAVVPATGTPLGRLPFITIDQEGGAVERLTEAVGFREVPDASTVARREATKEAEALYAGVGKGLREWGFNVNFAPVVDVNVNPQNPVIAKNGRAFSEDAGKVYDYARAAIDGFHEAGIITSIKHFPGHGSSTADSHEGFVDITETYRMDDELLPYRRLIGDGSLFRDFVMIGHLVDTKKDELPASLSRVWVTEVLRGELQYAGVTITDDMEMKAVRDLLPLAPRVVAAVRAGVDILLFSNTANPRLTIAKEIRDALIAEAKRDPAFLELIHESNARIVGLKERYGLAGKLD